MAKVIPSNAPDFWQISSNWEADIEKQSKEMENMRQVSAGIDIDKSLVGALLTFQIADGYAYYLVTKDKPLTLMHIPYMDGYQVHPILLKNLGAEDVKAMWRVKHSWDKLMEVINA